MKANINILSNIGTIAYIIAGLVIALFAFTFITISILYFRSRKKIIENALEDEEINKDVNKDLSSLLKKKRSNETINVLLNRKEKKDRKLNIINNLILIIFYLIVIGCLIFAFFIKQQNQQIWINNNSLLVVETSSMETPLSSNTYLFDDNNKAKYTSIKQDSLISISKNKKYINEIKLYDIIAFQVKNAQGKQITIIHRVIEISKDNDGNNIYTFRGDSNPYSLGMEIDVKQDQIIGVFSTLSYHGVNSEFLGYLVSYIQSPIGMIVNSIAILLLLLYSILSKKLFDSYDKRYDELLNERIKYLK